jgi:hypothetical protein
MANNPKFANAAVNAEADAVARQLDNGYLRIYDGAQPATADTAIVGQVLLAELRFNATSAPAAAAGVLTFNAFTSDASANATGTAAWFRALQSNGTSVVMDGTVGTVAGFDAIINSTAISSGAQVDCTAMTFTVSKG